MVSRFKIAIAIPIPRDQDFRFSRPKPATRPGMENRIMAVGRKVESKYKAKKVAIPILTRFSAMCNQPTIEICFSIFCIDWISS